ncbi:hypothetical protein PTKIN_Ptkin14bG0037000 [Pterospermum kingtungense]
MALNAYLQTFSTALCYAGSLLISVPVGVYVGKRLVLALHEMDAAKSHSCLNCHRCQGWGCNRKYEGFNRKYEEKENPNKNIILTFFAGLRK